MPEIDDDKVREFIKKAADGQAPDAWADIERRINHMEQQKTETNKGRKRFRGLPVAVAACAVVALAAVAVLARPTFLGFTPKATATPIASVAASAAASAAAPAATPSPAPAATATADVMKVREPIPFTDNSSLSVQKGPMLKIMFYETLKDFMAAEYNTDIAEFKFVKEVGTEPSAGGMGLYTKYEMQAVKVFKGNLKPGDTITLRVFGGANDKVWIEDNFVERFTGDFDYVLFLGKVDENTPDLYQLASTLQGYVPIREGRVSLNTKIENNGLYMQGETLEDLSQRIEDALK